MEVSAKYMFVNKVCFFVSVSHNLGFGTVEAALGKHMKMALGCIKNIVKLFCKTGFRITTLHLDKKKT